MLVEPYVPSAHHDNLGKGIIVKIRDGRPAIIVILIVPHHFTIGSIEKITLGKEFARIVHGGYVIPLVYAKGLRTAWYRIEKGMIINEDPKDQTNPFPTLVVATKGKGIAEIGGQEFSFSGGEAYYIPEHVTHVFWTDSDEGLEFIIIMYGEGA